MGYLALICAMQIVLGIPPDTCISSSRSIISVPLENISLLATLWHPGYFSSNKNDQILEPFIEQRQHMTGGLYHRLSLPKDTDSSLSFG